MAPNRAFTWAPGAKELCGGVKVINISPTPIVISVEAYHPSSKVPLAASPLLPTLLENMIPLLVAGEVALIGVAIAKTFRLKAKTDFYRLFRKKKLGVF